MAHNAQTEMSVKTSKRTTMRIRSTLFFLATLNIFACTDALSAPCEVPSDLKVPGKTFIINEKLSCGSNILLYAIPGIGLEADKQLSPEVKKNDPQAVGRLAYVLLGEEFAKNKPNVPVSDFKVSGKDGHHEIPVRLYEGKNEKKVILFTHGGGWTRGDLETHDTLCRNLCEATGASVLAVNYRLAPEHPHPAGLEDAVDAYNWLIAQHGKEAKVFIAGDSGGGNIATSLVLKMIKEGARIPDGAILMYPALDLRIPEKTTNPYAVGYMLTRDSINAYVNNYTGNNPEKANDPLVSPVMASDEELSKFPPVILINAECDPLTEEGKAFADRLMSLGVAVKHKIIPSVIHVFAQYFDLFPEATEAKDFIKEHLEKIGA
ncbi:MAG: alpha/beta hydrolase [Candidatus Paracaedibacter sp.]